jgi:hypothetical protein
MSRWSLVPRNQGKQEPRNQGSQAIDPAWSPVIQVVEETWPRGIKGPRNPVDDESQASSFPVALTPRSQGDLGNKEASDRGPMKPGRQGNQWTQLMVSPGHHLSLLSWCLDPRGTGEQEANRPRVHGTWETLGTIDQNLWGYWWRGSLVPGRLGTKGPWQCDGLVSGRLEIKGPWRRGNDSTRDQGRSDNTG